MVTRHVHRAISRFAVGLKRPDLESGAVLCTDSEHARRKPAAPASIVRGAQPRLLWADDRSAPPTVGMTAWAPWIRAVVPSEANRFFAKSRQTRDRW